MVHIQSMLSAKGDENMAWSTWKNWSCRVKACVPLSLRVTGCVCQQVGERRWFIQSCILFVNRTGFDALKAFRQPPVVCCNLGDDMPLTDFFQGFHRPTASYSVMSGAAALKDENLKTLLLNCRIVTFTEPDKLWGHFESRQFAAPFHCAHLSVNDSHCVLSGWTGVIKEVSRPEQVSVCVTVSTKHKHEAFTVHRSVT